MRTAPTLCLSLVLASLLGCPASPKEAQEGPAAEARKGPDKEQTSTMDSSRSTTPVCADLACLGQHEGELVQVEGTFVFPKDKAFARNKLSLADGTTIILSQPADESVRGQLSSANDGKKMKIEGRIFTKQIPDKYKIIGRTPDPYLVDIAKVDV